MFLFIYFAGLVNERLTFTACLVNVQPSSGGQLYKYLMKCHFRALYPRFLSPLVHGAAAQHSQKSLLTADLSFHHEYKSQIWSISIDFKQIVCNLCSSDVHYPHIHVVCLIELGGGGGEGLSLRVSPLLPLPPTSTIDRVWPHLIVFMLKRPFFSRVEPAENGLIVVEGAG